MLSLDEFHYPLLVKLLIGMGLSVGLGLLLARLRPGSSRIDKLLLAVAPASCLILLARCLVLVLTLDQVDWLSGRLTPALGLLRGYTLYYPKDFGPIYNTIYPPLGYLVYLPAGLMSTPTGALIAANAVGYLLVLAPILLLCLIRHGEEGRNRSLLVAVTVFFAFWKSAMSSALLATFTVHADAPALGFGVLACLVLYAGRGAARPSNRTLFGSALFATLALWSKQTTVALMAILPLWVLLAHGPRAAFRYLGWVAATLAAVTGALVAGLGAGPLFFNLLEIPKSHPWLYSDARVMSVVIMATEEGSICLPPLFAIAVLLYLSRRRWMPSAEGDEAPGRVAQLRAWLGLNSWALFAVVGSGMVPFAFLSRIKLGGSFNNYAPPLYYFSASACVLFLDWYARNRERGLHHVNDMMKVGLLVSSFSPILLYNFEFLTHVNFTRPTYLNCQEQAFEYAKKHPQEAYFPWNPLSSLMAEGRAYHFEYGVFDRDLGQVVTTDEHYRSALPEKIRLVAYPPNRIMEYSRFKYLVDFKKPVQVAELPGWYCYER